MIEMDLLLNIPTFPSTKAEFIFMPRTRQKNVKPRGISAET
jgi:hypothetical protein